ncbi:MAG: VOC family protein [Burkholderiales bacterium]
MQLDHIVIAVHDLQRTVADYQALGFTVTPGGQHPGRTSHNALVVFADGAYLELIAWQAPAPQERWWRDLQQFGDGPVDFALLPADVVAATKAARASGLELSGPLDGSRKQPDGAELKWQTARHATPDVPFLCADITPRSWRVPEGVARQHANGVTGVSSLSVAVADLGVTLPRYEALLGPAAVIGIPFVMPGSGLRIAQMQIDGLSLVLAEGVGELQATGALGHCLDTRGQGPCAFSLVAPDRTPRTLTAGLSHGAVIETLANEARAVARGIAPA